MRPSQFYILVGVLCLGGYLLLANYYYKSVKAPHAFGSCIVKKVYGIPCPTCGSTRSVISILNGNLIEGFFINPLGLLMLFGLIVLPFWLIFDWTVGRSSLFTAFQFVEGSLRRRRTLSLFLALLMLGNWCWNIYKNL